MRKKRQHINAITIGKTPYLKSLENRKNSKINQNEETKATAIIDKLLSRDNCFNRDYSSIFGCALPPNHQQQFNKISLYKPGIKIHLRSETEANYPHKYLNKPIDYDEFSMIYRKPDNDNKLFPNKKYSQLYKSTSLRLNGLSVINSYKNNIIIQ